VNVGDLIKLPQDRGYAIAMEIVERECTVYGGTVVLGASVKVIMPYGEDWWDAEACEVLSESR
jgi:hypothetical protein